MSLGTQHDRAGLRYFKTICLSAAFFVLGLCVALLGPTIPTLAYNLGVEDQDFSFIYTSRGIGYLFGSLLCAFLFKKMDGYLLISICLIFTAVGTSIVPLMPYLILLGAAVMTTGISMGILDTGGNVLCLNLWGTESEPWMQTLHFFFAFGATLAPLLANPFIRESHEEFLNENQTAMLEGNETEHTGTTHAYLPSPTEADMSFPEVAWAFVITGCAAMTVSVSFYFLSIAKNVKTESTQEDTIKLEGTAYRIKVMALLFLFYFLYVGTEVTFGLFIYSFAINCEMQYSKQTGTSLNSLFWGIFAAGRFFAIFFSRCITPKTMLVADLLGTAISTAVLSLFPYYGESQEWLLWAAVALYGWSMASLFPTGLTWAEHYITVTENAATTFVVGASLGEMALPFIVSHMIARNPMNLMYFCAASTLICIINFLVLLKVTSSRGSRLNLTKSKSSIEMAEDDKTKYDRVPTSDAELHSDQADCRA